MAAVLRSRVSAKAFSLPLRRCVASEGSFSLLTNSRSEISQSKSCISRLSRLLTGASCEGSLQPLHSAIATARLNSELAAESQHWGWVPQGLSMPL